MGRHQMDVILSESIEFAAYLLERNKEFFPFGVVMTPFGEIRHTVGHCSQAPSSYIPLSRYPGVKTDAIRIEIEDTEVEPITCFVPYNFEGEKVVLGEITAKYGTGSIF